MDTYPAEAVFHQGEQRLQARVGMQQKLAKIGSRVIRDHMPQPHRELFEKLPMLVIGAIDQQGRPWTSLLTGKPGFIQAPNPCELVINSHALPFDPIVKHLQVSSDIGLLGIELETRRRNRVNAVITQIREGQIRLRVKQSFGNCPRYIQKRRQRWRDWDIEDVSLTVFNAFDGDAQRLLETADSFFISSFYNDGSDQPNRGFDVSHRGGKPGFVRIDNPRTLTFPDYNGNRYFNTLGNLCLNPSTGLLLIDYVYGSLLYLTGHTEIVWDADQIKQFEGAERLLRFTLDEGLRVSGALPFTWEFLEYSPFLLQTSTDT